LANLENLYIGGNQIDDAGLSALVVARGGRALPNLRILDLSASRGNIGDASIRALADNWRAMANLERLHLSGNNISNVRPLIHACKKRARKIVIELFHNPCDEADLSALDDACGRGSNGCVLQ
jgi:Leucine-rich repeat (LRR) protein